jgi:hypothetical protein
LHSRTHCLGTGEGDGRWRDAATDGVLRAAVLEGDEMGDMVCEHVHGGHTERYGLLEEGGLHGASGSWVTGHGWHAPCLRRLSRR